MKEIHLEKREKIKNLGRLKSLKIYGNIDEKDFEEIKNSNIKNLDLSGAINTELPDLTFFEFESLVSIVLPNNLVSIGEECFCNCFSLQKVKIPNSVCSIGRSAFGYCDSLSFIEIPDSVLHIGEEAFVHCLGLTSIKFPPKLKIIEKYVLKDCVSIQTIEIPKSVIKIDDTAFDGIESLEKIKLENGNKNYVLDEDVLLNKNKTHIIKCPNGKKGLYKIPNTVETVNSASFMKTKITALCILESPTSIGSSAFHFCESLATVQFDKNSIIKKFAIGLFNGCKSLKTIILPNTLKKIKSYVFENCSSLESIELPDSILEIGPFAFQSCTSLITIKLPKDIKELASGIFEDCKSLTTVYIPKNLKRINFWAFKSCNALKSLICTDFLDVESSGINFPSNIEIERKAFESCHSLESIKLPKKIKFVKGDFNSTFYDCISLKEITVDLENKDYSSIDGILYDKKKTALIRFPLNSLKKSYCIPNTVKIIKESAFELCKFIKQIRQCNKEYTCKEGDLILPETINLIEKYAFANLPNLMFVKLTNRLMNLSSYVFKDCMSLQTVSTHKELLKTRCIFQGCIKLALVSIEQNYIYLEYSDKKIENDFFNYNDEKESDENDDNENEFNNFSNDDHNKNIEKEDDNYDNENENLSNNKIVIGEKNDKEDEDSDMDEYFDVDDNDFGRKESQVDGKFLIKSVIKKSGQHYKSDDNSVFVSLSNLYNTIEAWIKNKNYEYLVPNFYIWLWGF